MHNSIVNPNFRSFFVIRKRAFVWFLLASLMFVWIFPPPLSIAGSLFHLKNPIAGLLIIGLLLYFVYKRKGIKRDFLLFFSYLLCVFIFALIMFVYHGIADAYGVQTLFWAMSFFLSSFALALIYRYFYEDNFVKMIFLHLIAAGILHSVLIYALFLSDTIRDLLYSILHVEGNAKVFVERNFRLHGVRTGGGADLSVIHGLFSLITIFFVYFYRKILSIRTMSILLFSSIIVFFSNTFIARTGFVVSIVGFSFLLIYAFILPRINLKIIKSICLSFFFLFILSITLFTQIPDDTWDHFMSAVAPRAFELIINIYSGQGATTTSTETLSTMNFWPQAMLLGEGLFGRNQELGYVASDIGYVRFVFGFGLLGSVILYLFYVLVMIYSVMRYKLMPLLSFTLVVFSSIILFVNVKELHSFATIGSSHMYFLLLSALILAKRGRSIAG